MQIDIMSFTRRGIELSAKIRECLYSCGKGYEVCLYTKYGRYQEISDAEIQTEWIREHNRANGKNPVYVKESIYDWMRARFEQNRNGKRQQSSGSAHAESRCAPWHLLCVIN